MGKVPVFLKVFVIAGGVLVVAGVLLLTVLLAQRATNRAEPSGPKTAGPVDLALPAEARIEQVVLDGRNLVLLAAGRDGQQYLAVVNSLTGERLSLIRVRPEP